MLRHNISPGVLNKETPGLVARRCMLSQVYGEVIVTSATTFFLILLNLSH